MSASNGLGCISAIALKDVENSKALFEVGLSDVIIQCMLIHENDINVVVSIST